MNPAYAKKLRLRIRQIGMGAQKIDGSNLNIFVMVIVSFSLQDKLGKFRFFQETFLMADTTIEVVFKMLFLTFSIADTVCRARACPKNL